MTEAVQSLQALLGGSAPFSTSSICRLSSRARRPGRFVSVLQTACARRFSRMARQRVRRHSVCPRLLRPWDAELYLGTALATDCDAGARTISASPSPSDKPRPARAQHLGQRRRSQHAGALYLDAAGCTGAGYGKQTQPGERQKSGAVPDRIGKEANRRIGDEADGTDGASALPRCCGRRFGSSTIHRRHVLLNRYWVMAALCDGMVVASLLWLGVVVCSWSRLSAMQLGFMGNLGIALSAIAVVLFVREAERYTAVQIDDLISTLAWDRSRPQVRPLRFRRRLLRQTVLLRCRRPRQHRCPASPPNNDAAATAGAPDQSHPAAVAPSLVQSPTAPQLPDREAATQTFGIKLVDLVIDKQLWLCRIAPARTGFFDGTSLFFHRRIARVEHMQKQVGFRQIPRASREMPSPSPAASPE